MFNKYKEVQQDDEGTDSSLPLHVCLYACLSVSVSLPVFVSLPVSLFVCLSLFLSFSISLLHICTQTLPLSLCESFKTIFAFYVHNLM